MNLHDTIGLSLRNLSQAKLRTALTTLGVSIGIASLAGMVSLGVGLQDQMVGRFLQSGVFGTITVMGQSDLPGALAQLGGSGSRGSRGPRGPRGPRGRSAPGASDAPETPPPKLDDDAVKQIAAFDNVRDVYPDLRLPLEAKIDDFSRPVLAVGVPMASKNEGAFQTISYGRFFASGDEKACMISLDIARQIASQDPSSVLNKSIKLTYAAAADGQAIDPIAGFQVRRVDLECPVVGIVERSTGGFPGGGAFGGVSGLMLPINTAQKIDAEILTGPPSAMLRDAVQRKSYSSLTVKVKQPQYTQDVEDRLRKIGYNVFSIDDALRGAKNAFILLDIFLSLIGSIALAVSSLGIVNTMVMSILERTREIGIMKAIGASDSDIRRIFLIEASVIGLLGGFAGIALGWIVGRLINFGANVYIQSQGGTAGTLFSLPLWLIASAIGFSIAVSLLAGSYPAARAAKLDPIRALRHD